MRVRDVAFGLLDTMVKVALVVAAVTLIMRYAGVAYDYGYQIYNQQAAKPYDSSTLKITVTDEMSVMDLAKRLEMRGLIKDARLFWLQERFSERHGKIVPGTYELSPSQTPAEMIMVMSEGYTENADESEDGG